jgi:peptidoglycan/LPS O-acetylase OafA/YrhL
MNQLKTRIFFPNLDGLRFIAFISVFFHHTILPEYFDKTMSSGVYKFIFAQKINGALGVNLFFVLSGFLITYLLINEKEKFSKIHILNFYTRRVLRIWPLYFLIVIIGFFIFPIVKKMMGASVHETATLPFYILFISNFQIIQKGFPDSVMLGVLWSVGIEEQYYIIWPLLLSFISKKYLPKILLLLIACTLVFRYMHSANYLVVYLNTFSVLSDMMIGGLAAYLIFYSQGFKNFISRLSKKAIISIYIVGATLIIFNYKIFTTGISITFERLAYSLFFAFIILEQNFAEHSFYKISNNKFLSKWGAYTYGLYCLHFPAIIISHIFSENILKLHNQLALMAIDYRLGIGLAMLMAYLSYKFYETPFLKLKNRFAYFKK